MNSKTIAALPLLLLVPTFTTPAEARGPEARERRVAATAPVAPAVLPAPVDDRSGAIQNPQPRTESAERAEKGGRTEDERAGDAPAPDGFSIAARVGYALPMGSIAKDARLNGNTDLSKTASGMVPFWGELGYRINERWYVGGYFQLGILGTSADLCNGATAGNNAGGTSASGKGCSSTGTDIRFGALVRYTIKPGAKISPWVGISSGYEITSVSISMPPQTGDATAKGWEFVGLHLGGDVKLAPTVSVGPTFMASFGQYGGFSTTVSGANGAQSESADYTNTALHEWIFFGLRGQYDL
jgi:hypothetical protein